MAPEDIKRLSVEMATAVKKPSGTIRRGMVGSWRDEFQSQHVEAFRRSDPNGWLLKLGFEKDPDWNLEAQ